MSESPEKSDAASPDLSGAGENKSSEVIVFLAIAFGVVILVELFLGLRAKPPATPPSSASSAGTVSTEPPRGAPLRGAPMKAEPAPKAEPPVKEPTKPIAPSEPGAPLAEIPAPVAAAIPEIKPEEKTTSETPSDPPTLVNPPKPAPVEEARDLKPKASEPAVVEVERSGDSTTLKLPPPPSGVDLTATPQVKTGEKTALGATVLGFDKLCGYEYYPQPAGIPKEKLPKQIPDDVQAFDGKKVEVSGFMLPVDVEENGDVKVFFLMRDIASCCFGGAPKLNEWVLVTAGKNFTARYTGYAPIAVTGTIEVGEKIEYGRVTSLYRLEAEALEVRD